MTPLPRTVAALNAGITAGWHTGAQAFVSLRGETKADIALGESRPGRPMAPDTLMAWQSCTKPVVAVALARLWEQGRLDLDDRVTTFIPEFGANGKDAVTIRHLLTHTGGFRYAKVRWFSEPPETALRRICEAPLEPGWIPGCKAGYHAATSWMIMGETIRRLDGRPVERVLREDIFEPLGMRDSWLAMDPETFAAYGERIGYTFDTSSGVPRHQPMMDTPAACSRPRPGASGRGPAHDLGRFYQMLLNGGEGILRPQTVRAITACHRAGMFDHTFQAVVDWGLGFLMNSSRYDNPSFGYGFGPYASPHTYGHGGYQTSISFADPEHALAVAVIVNGAPGEQKHNRLFRSVTAAIYQDLGLVP